MAEKYIRNLKNIVYLRGCFNTKECARLEPWKSGNQVEVSMWHTFARFVVSERMTSEAFFLSLLKCFQLEITQQHSRR